VAAAAGEEAARIISSASALCCSAVAAVRGRRRQKVAGRFSRARGTSRRCLFGRASCARMLRRANSAHTANVSTTTGNRARRDQLLYKTCWWMVVPKIGREQHPLFFVCRADVLRARVPHRPAPPSVWRDRTRRRASAGVFGLCARSVLKESGSERGAGGKYFGSASSVSLSATLSTLHSIRASPPPRSSVSPSRVSAKSSLNTGALALKTQ
jgi:hypothetical protein